MLGAAPEEMKEKAEKLQKMLRERGIDGEVIPTCGQVGGGSVPTKDLPSFAVALGGNANALEEKLRRNPTPIIGRIHEGKFLLDVRTLFEGDFAVIVEALA
jgi:L-seryl-tRNA(Ser) seleniumtransferase